MTETQPAPSPTAGARHVVVVPGSIDMVSLLGPGDDHLSLIERSFDLRLHVRGNRITLEGDPGEVALAERLLDELVTLIRTGQGITGETVERVLAMLRAETTERPADVMSRFGTSGNTNSLLHLLCGTDVKASNTTTCTRYVSKPMTILGVAGHMHLLGRKLKIEVNPGTPDARTILDIPVWDFDNQGTKPIKPVHVDQYDTVKITCKHVQWLRDVLPAFEGIPDKYVIWAEGTTDEMCLGMLSVAFDDERS